MAMAMGTPSPICSSKGGMAQPMAAEGGPNSIMWKSRWDEKTVVSRRIGVGGTFEKNAEERETGEMASGVARKGVSPYVTRV